MTSSTSSLLKDPSLLDLHGYDTSETFPVFNPADPESIVGHVPIMNGASAKQAIEQSHQALPQWRDGTTAAFRSSLLTKWSQMIQENAEDIATIMTLESGKPVQESRGEVSYGTSFLDFFAAEAVRQNGAGGGMLLPTSFSTSEGKPRGHVMAMQQAVGVTAIVTPWNFPIAMITRKLGPALAAGCTSVLKPAQLTPLTAVALQNLAERAGFPPNVLQLM